MHCMYFFSAFNKIVILKKDLCLHNLQLQAVSKSKHHTLCPHRPERHGGDNANIQSSIYYHFLLTMGINLLSQKEVAFPGAGCVWLAEEVCAPESVQSPYTSEGKNTSQERNNGLQAPLHHRSQCLFQHTHDKF